MANKPIIHGRDHRPGGADPIPNIGQIALASARTSTGRTVAGDNAQHYISLQDGVFAHFSTNNPDVFDNSSTTLFTGGAIYGIGVLAVGTYKYEWYARPESGGTAGAILDVYWSSSGTAILSALQLGRTSTTIGEAWDGGTSAHLFWTEYQSFDSGGTPGVAAPWVRLHSGADITIGIELIVTQINTSYNPQL